MVEHGLKMVVVWWKGGGREGVGGEKVLVDVEVLNERRSLPISLIYNPSSLNPSCKV